ncbi:MAG: hypothetical protein V2A70_03900 [Candidatus Omnitrophota bacterium]
MLLKKGNEEIVGCWNDAVRLDAFGVDLEGVGGMVWVKLLEMRRESITKGQHMNLDKVNKAIWTIIGAVVLLGILVSVGGIVWGVLGFNRHPSNGIEVQTEKNVDKERSYVLKTVYEMPLLTEGADFFMVPVGLKKVYRNQKAEGYSFGKSGEVSSWGGRSYSKVAYMGYNYSDSPCHNLIFINKKTGQAQKLLNEKAYIGAVYFPEKKYLPEEKSKPTFILLTIGKSDINGDGTINHKDGLAGYLVGLDGKGLTQVTLSGTNMGSWRYDQDSKKLFVNVVEDSNGDKKFSEEDQERLLVVDTQAPGMGTELVSDVVKKDVDGVVQY